MSPQSSCQLSVLRKKRDEGKISKISPATENHCQNPKILPR